MTEISLRHHWDTTETSPKHHQDITDTSLRHHWHKTETSLKHHRHITQTRPRRPGNMTETSKRHHWNTTKTTPRPDWDILKAWLRHYRNKTETRPRHHQSITKTSWGISKAYHQNKTETWILNVQHSLSKALYASKLTVSCTAFGAALRRLRRCFGLRDRGKRVPSSPFAERPSWPTITQLSICMKTNNVEHFLCHWSGIESLKVPVLHDNFCWHNCDKHVFDTVEVFMKHARLSPRMMGTFEGKKLAQAQAKQVPHHAPLNLRKIFHQPLREIIWAN